MSVHHRGGCLAAILCLTLAACDSDDTAASASAGGEKDTTSDTDFGSTGASVTGDSEGLSFSASETGTSEASTGTTDPTTGADACSGASLELPSGELACCGLPPSEYFQPIAFTLEVRLNGELYPGSPSEYGYLHLEDPKTGDAVFLGTTSHTGVSGVALAGSYRVIYSFGAGGSVMPRNKRAVIGEVTLPGSIAGGVLTVDIPTVHLSGALTFNAADPPTSVYDSADIFLRDPVTGSRTLVAVTHLSPTIDAVVIPGEYELRYSNTAAKNVMPQNHDAWIGAAAIGDADTDLGVVDVPVAPVAFSLTINKDAPPTTIYDNAAIYARDAGGDVIKLGETRFGPIAGRLIASPSAAYSLHYARIQSKLGVPANEWATLSPAQPAGSLPSAIDIEAVMVAPKIALDQAPVVKDPSNSGVLSLRAGDDRVRLGATKDTIEQSVIPAIYDVLYGHESSTGVVPVNNRALIREAVAINGQDPALDIAIESTLVAGKFLIDGMAPPTSAYDSGRISLRSGDGDLVVLGNTRDGAFSRRIARSPGGLFDVVYSVEAAGAKVPHNSEVVLAEDVDLAAIGDVSITTVAFSQALDLGLTLTGQDRGHFYLRRALSDDEVFVGEASWDALDARLVPGEYFLVYRGESTSGALPRNTDAVIGCYSVY